MNFFALPYIITFDDSMAYGTHHYLTNFKFQCAARETLLFGKIIPDQKDWRDEISGILMLTQEGYSRNISAVPVGEKVVIYMSFEEPGISSVRLCFRVVSGEGEPVACGFQFIVCADTSGKGLVDLPAAFTQFSYRLEEEAKDPCFKDRALNGGKSINALFPRRLVDSAKSLCSESDRNAYPQLVCLE